MVKAEALDDATLVVTFAAEARARRAALSSPACRSSRRPITRRVHSMNRRSIFRSAPGPTRSASSRSIATSNSTGSRIGGAPTFRSAAAATISIPCVTSSIATATSPSRASPARNYLYPRGVHLADLGDALRFPGGQGRPRQARDAARRDAVRRAGLVHQYPPRQVQGSAGARGADPARSISSGPTRPSCTAPMRAPIRRSRIPT